MNFHFFLQFDQLDCGPTCLRMVAKYYKKDITLQELRDKSHISREGVNLADLCHAAESIGFRATPLKGTFSELVKDIQLPCIAFWDQNHFVVITKISTTKIWIADPAHGHVAISHKEFISHWATPNTHFQKDEAEGIVLALEPKPAFYEEETTKKEGLKLSAYLVYLKPHKKLLIQVCIGLGIITVLELIAPFLSQSLVDIGIQQQNLKFVQIVLVAQLMIFVGSTAESLIRGWLLLYIGTRMNIAVLSDFLAKLLKLPFGFFETKTSGDLLQRIEDNHRLKSLLTSGSISTLFSFINLIIFGGILAMYSLKVMMVFSIGSILGIGWVFLFLKRRRHLDYALFSKVSEEQNKIIEICNGISDIKLSNCENQKRWEWETLQNKIFKLSIKQLSLDQVESVGISAIFEFKNILISILTATLVINGKMTLGMLMSVQYMLGHLNGPISHFMTLVHQIQGTKIALERLNEVQGLADEEDSSNPLLPIENAQNIVFDQVSFQYGGEYSGKVLDQISLTLPKGSVTAIVGPSGSGKTTLLKLLLRFYEPTEGQILLDKTPLKFYSHQSLRKSCGVVMQDGYLFSDTIAKNITLGEETISTPRLMAACKMANVSQFVETLPLGYQTRIGQDGLGLSHGQKQRILIARAIYKDPQYLFFDEATSALDAKNETEIVTHLNTFYEGKTVVVIAHRLSTVKNADQIIVLNNGHISERGTHQELITLNGFYMELIRNQLELGA